jgi:hypothetical protein
MKSGPAITPQRSRARTAPNSAGQLPGRRKWVHPLSPRTNVRGRVAGAIAGTPQDPKGETQVVGAQARGRRFVDPGQVPGRQAKALPTRFAMFS